MQSPEPRHEHLKIAAIGDLHVNEHGHAQYRALFSRISREADILLLCGDLTNFGSLTEAEHLAEDLAACSIPVFGVLGNHDYERGEQTQVRNILSDAGFKFVDEQAEVCKGWGIAGVKGFGGGFGSHMIPSFGEPLVKQFVKESVKEALHLEKLLGTLTTKRNIVVLHYAPNQTTVMGEPLEIYPVLGSSRLAEVIDRFPVSAVFHGHTHLGIIKGKTALGIPVYNCARDVLLKHGKEYFVIEVR